MSRVLLWTASEDGSSWYRGTNVAEALQWSGHTTLETPAPSPHQLAEADVIIGSRVANPGPAQLWQNIKLTRTNNEPKLVLDLDDAYFSVPQDNPAYSTWGDPMVLERLAASAHAADVITVASEGIAHDVMDALLARGLTESPPIVVIGNGLHAGYLSTPRNYDPDVLTVGWSGTRHTGRDFDLVAMPLARIIEYGTNDFKVGDGPRAHVQGRLVGLPFDHPSLPRMARYLGGSDLLQATEWVPHGQPYLSTVAGFDIWVAPYRSDPFTDAKFPTKALEAGMLGIPLIAGDIPPYRAWIEDGVNGFLVDEHKPWLWSKRLKELVDSPSLRKTMGEAARSMAAPHIMQELGRQWSDVCTLGTTTDEEAAR